MATDLGVESFLGDADADELGNADAREKLALATRYLANWYKATSDSDNKAVWYQKIDTLRNKVESLYTELTADDNPFLSPSEVTEYNGVSANWAELWRDLNFSTDTIDVSLINQAADLATTIIKAPTVAIPNLMEALGKLVNDSVGKFMAQAYPVILLIGGVAVVYVFRKPLATLASKVSA